MISKSVLTPVLQYRDVAGSAVWLSDAFGFAQPRFTTGPSGDIAYASLQSGGSTILVWPVGRSALDQFMAEPAAMNGANTQLCYLAVDDIDRHFQHAQDAGAKIETELQDAGDGGRFYVCRDREGHLWSFGTRLYSDAAGLAQERQEPPQGKPRAPAERPRHRWRVAIVTLSVVAFAALGLPGWNAGPVNSFSSEVIETARLVDAAEHRPKLGIEASVLSPSPPVELAAAPPPTFVETASHAEPSVTAPGELLRLGAAIPALETLDAGGPPETAHAVKPPAAAKRSAALATLAASEPSKAPLAKSAPASITGPVFEFFMPAIIVLKDDQALHQLFAELKERHPAALARRHAYVRHLNRSGEALYQLLVGPAGTRAQAKSVCKNLGAEGEALGCTVVAVGPK